MNKIQKTAKNINKEVTKTTGEVVDNVLANGKELRTLATKTVKEAGKKIDFNQSIEMIRKTTWVHQDGTTISTVQAERLYWEAWCIAGQEGLASFTALQERQIPSQLLVFPTENHWVLGAKNSLQWHDTVFAWLDRWLKPESDSE